MQKRPYILLIAATAIFLSFMLGFFVGRQGDRNTASFKNTAAEKVDDSSDGTASEDTSPDFKININTADASQLTLLDGIGEALADRIIEYRQANGPFSSIEELQNVNGIGQKKFEQIADYITIGG